MQHTIPESYFVYEYSYPEGLPEAGVIFYVGKGTHASRMDDHLREAAGDCQCKKCATICSIWDAGLTPVRRIVFESPSEEKTLSEEQRRILLYDGPHLTNDRKPKTTSQPATPRKRTGNTRSYSMPHPLGVYRPKTYKGKIKKSFVQNIVIRSDW